MPCYSPLEGWRSKRVNPSGKRSIVFKKSEGFADMPIQVPCGQCIGCRLEHSRKWAVRCLHEAQMHESNCFITLTYCDQKLPKHGTLVKEHFQKFMMRLRKRYGKGIKFYACGEYGEKRKRPHYHACLFGLDFADKRLWKVADGNNLYVSQQLDTLWTDPSDGQPYGFCTIGEVNFETAAYVARYCMKKRKGKNWEQDYEFTDTETGEILMMQPEFPLMSRNPGIGKTWMEKYQSDVYPHDHVIIRGREMKPPRYYDNLFEKDNPTDMDEVKMLRRKAAKEQKNDNTLARLHTRGLCKKAQTNQLKRSYENDTESIHSL